MNENIILISDSYKMSHYLQYPEGTEYVFSYIESRGGQFDETVMFGLQAIVERYLTKPITQADIEEAAAFAAAHGEPFNREGWQYILDEHNGLLPLAIGAVPEGSVVPVKNVLAIVVNTDPKCFWLTSYFEPMLLRAWYPITVATQSREAKKLIKNYLELTADSIEGLPFKLHDFGARGVSSHESAAIGGAAHLVNFMGSDTIEGVMYANKYYDHPMSAFSIPAAEHSTMCAEGRVDEIKQFERMLDQFPSGLVAVVSDGYDIWNAIYNYWGKTLKDKVLARDGVLVVRPDSGDPLTVVVEVVDRLCKAFGYTVNEKGFKLLPPQVRVIQGDGINVDSLEGILKALHKHGFSTDNVAFGMGGGLLQQIDRDTQKFAMKACAMCVNGEWREVFKDPITDQGKKSKRGLLKLVKDDNGVYQTVKRSDPRPNELKEMYRDGVLLIRDNLDTIRERAEV